jgi:hypothetical protein
MPLISKGWRERALLRTWLQEELLGWESDISARGGFGGYRGRLFLFYKKLLQTKDFILLYTSMSVEINERR